MLDRFKNNNHENKIIIMAVTINNTLDTFSKGSTLLTGLVSVWKLDETSGTIDDAVGTNDGTLTGATYNQDGKIGRSVLFDAANEIINCGTASSLQLTTALSISLWVKAVTTQVTWGRLVNKEGCYGIYLNYQYNCISFLGSGIDTAFDTTADEPYTLNSNTWRHVAITFSTSNQEIRYYLDGVQYSAMARTTALTDSSAIPLTIGNRVAGDRYIVGNIDNVHLWNIALTTTQITELYTKENVGTTYPW